MTQSPQLPKQLAMYRGDSLVLDLLVTQSGQPQDLDGAKIWFTAKRNLTDPDNQAVIQVTTPTDIIIAPDQSGEDRGRATINVPAAVTAVLTEQTLRLFYDIQVRFATGRVQTVEFGTLIVTSDVTQAISLPPGEPVILLGHEACASGCAGGIDRRWAGSQAR